MRLFLHQLRAEQRLFWRSHELAFFSFLLPIVFLLLLSSAYGDEEINGVRGYDYVLAGMLGYGVAATAFGGFAIVLIIRREAGTLKRLRATPLPGLTFIAAVVASIVLVFLLESALLVACARVFFDVPVPDSLLSLVLTVLLGAFSFAALAIGLTGLIRSAEGSSAVVTGIYLPITFISGSFFSEDSFPRFLQVLGEVLPLRSFIELVRDLILEDEQIWSQPLAVGVVAAWGIAGTIVAARRFRWEPREG